METLVSPSLLSADFGQLDRDIDMINQSKADWLHLDIMDGVFVPNISFGFPVMEAVAKRNGAHYLNAADCEFNAVDFTHLSRRGHTQLAGRLAELVPELIG